MKGQTARACLVLTNGQPKPCTSGGRAPVGRAGAGGGRSGRGQPGPPRSAGAGRAVRVHVGGRVGARARGRGREWQACTSPTRQLPGRQEARVAIPRPGGARGSPRAHQTERKQFLVPIMEPR